MSILLDRLVGYDTESHPDKSKLPIHQFVDALYLYVQGWTGAPTRAEIDVAFQLSGQAYDPGDTQVDDANALVALVQSGTRSRQDVMSVLRLAERYHPVITKQRVLQMLSLA